MADQSKKRRRSARLGAGMVNSLPLTTYTVRREALLSSRNNFVFARR